MRAARPVLLSAEQRRVERLASMKSCRAGSMWSLTIWDKPLGSIRFSPSERVARFGTVGAPRGTIPSANLLRLVSEKITVMGSIMGTLEEMHNMIRLVIDGGLSPRLAR
jgi:hypothetical protein